MQCFALAGFTSFNAHKSTCLGTQSLRKEVYGKSSGPYLPRIRNINVGQNINMFSKAKGSLQAADRVQEVWSSRLVISVATFWTNTLREGNYSN